MDGPNPRPTLGMLGVSQSVPRLYEALCQVGGLQSKHVLLLGVVGRLGRERVLQVDRVGTQRRALVGVLVGVQIERRVA